MSEYLIEEYKTLREEILSSIKSQTAIFQIGLATLSFMFVASMRFHLENDAFFIINLFLIPLISNVFILLWSAEYRRMKRAGTYLLRIEPELFGELGGWTRYKRNHSSERSKFSAKNLKITILLIYGLLSFLYGISYSFEVYAAYMLPAIIVYITMTMIALHQSHRLANDDDE